MADPALRIHAGPTALAQLRRTGLRPESVQLVAGAAGGPKGLVLGALDRHLFGHWLPQSAQPVHLVGASIGAWRMAAAAMADPDAAFARLTHDYVHQRYEIDAGRTLPNPAQVTRGFRQALASFFDGAVAGVLAHPRYRLHVVTSPGRHVLGRDGRFLSRLSTPAGYLGALVSNAVSRKALGGWLERVLFSSAGDPLPVDLSDLRHRRVALTADNFASVLLASCSIPFALQSVRDIPGAPAGVYWDGGITDYHLHWNYPSINAAAPPGEAGLVLYPHFQRTVVPGWLDKGLKRRHRPTAFLDNVIVLAPSPEWVATLPNGKLPDRGDFTAYRHDWPARMRAWSQAVAASERLAEDFDAAVRAGPGLRVEPL